MGLRLMDAAVVRRCATAGLSLVMAGAGLGLGLGDPGVARAAGPDDSLVAAHGLQFELPKGVDDYDGYLKEAWESDGTSPLTVTLEITHGDGFNSGSAAASEAFAAAVRSEITLRTEWRGQRLLGSMMRYSNDSLSFDVYYFYSKTDDVMYAWAPILLADGSTAEFEVACPFDDFPAQGSAIDGFFGSLGSDGSTGDLELYGSTAADAGDPERAAWYGVGAAVPEDVREDWLLAGTYFATGKGIGGDVPVTVIVNDGKISEVIVGSNSETAGVGSKAIEQLPDAIVAANGTEGVDAVSGATISSKAIFAAVNDCLAQAAPGQAGKETTADAKTDAKVAADDGASVDASAAEGSTLKDGTYEAQGKGIGGRVPVTVTVEGGKIASVEVGDNSETAGIGSKAIEQLPAEIVENNGTEGVDGVSGATITSKAIFTAVDDCVTRASEGGTSGEESADKIDFDL